MSPDHECGGLTRRFFFGILAGAAAVLLAPPPVIAAPAFELTDLRFRSGVDVMRLVASLQRDHSDWRFETVPLNNFQAVTMIRKRGEIKNVFLHLVPASR